MIIFLTKKICYSQTTSQKVFNENGTKIFKWLKYMFSLKIKNIKKNIIEIKNYMNKKQIV